MKRSSFLIILIMEILICCGCAKEYDKTKVSDIDYTIVTEEEMTEELKSIVQESKKENFRKTYSDGDYLYLLIGYGAQPTSNYSIEIEELYQSSDAIYVTTMLKGPSRAETVIDKETYPYIIIKVEYSDKAVVFQ